MKDLKDYKINELPDQEKGVRAVLNTKINADIARYIRKCFKAHMQNYNGAGLLTEEVVFDKAELIAWLNEADKAGADNIRVIFGFYDNFISQGYNLPGTHRNRITAMLWPYKGDNTHRKPGVALDEGEEVEPFNLGNLKP